MSVTAVSLRPMRHGVSMEAFWPEPAMGGAGTEFDTAAGQCYFKYALFSGKKWPLLRATHLHKCFFFFFQDNHDNFVNSRRVLGVFPISSQDVFLRVES